MLGSGAEPLAGEATRCSAVVGAPHGGPGGHCHRRSDPHEAPVGKKCPHWAPPPHLPLQPPGALLLPALLKWHRLVPAAGSPAPGRARGAQAPARQPSSPPLRPAAKRRAAASSGEAGGGAHAAPLHPGTCASLPRRGTAQHPPARGRPRPPLPRPRSHCPGLAISAGGSGAVGVPSPSPPQLTSVPGAGQGSGAGVRALLITGLGQAGHCCAGPAPLQLAKVPEAMGTASPSPHPPRCFGSTKKRLLSPQTCPWLRVTSSSIASAAPNGEGVEGGLWGMLGVVGDGRDWEGGGGLRGLGGWQGVGVGQGRLGGLLGRMAGFGGGGGGVGGVAGAGGGRQRWG